MRVTGKLLKNTETGKEFACRESVQTDIPDDAVLLQSIDIEYIYPRDYVQRMVGDGGRLEVVRDLHNKEYPFQRRRIIAPQLKD